MKLTILTLFPELIEAVIGSSITGRARAAGLFELQTIQIRDYAVNRYGQIDDSCYGGGTGMLMMAEPIWQAWQTAVRQSSGVDETHKKTSTRTLYLSPRGNVFDQKKAKQLSADYTHLIFLCGHYEGVDQRVLDEIVDEELSIGDYVLTGGELAACVVIDALLRLVPGVLPDETAYLRESHTEGLLEYPQYTRPANWHNHKVPDVLLSGHQAKIEAWQEAQSVLETLRRRPDLMQQRKLVLTQWLNVIRQGKT